jgi:hypothetical protein
MLIEFAVTFHSTGPGMELVDGWQGYGSGGLVPCYELFPERSFTVYPDRSPVCAIQSKLQAAHVVSGDHAGE